MDVHRYWKVLTLYLPPQKWYTDTRSPWTLDYPPGFACLEVYVDLYINIRQLFTSVHTLSGYWHIW
jgi:hypothetical protein